MSERQPRRGKDPLESRTVVPIGERYLRRTGEPENMAEHLGKIPGVTHRISSR
jgi:hypothetical protein